MITIYGYIFWFGVIYAVFSFFLGQFTGGSVDGMDGVEIDVGSADVGDAGFESSTVSGGSDYTVSPFKPIVIATFCIVFGGTGMTALRLNLNIWLVFFVSIGVGVMIAMALYKFIVAPLYRAQNTSAATRKDLLGLKALVTSPVYQDGFGTISYRINGNIYNGPAKSYTGEAIEQGVNTTIVGFEGRAFVVTITDKISDID
jgi:membrane protein implicated in regulation of membrane protease activity